VAAAIVPGATSNVPFWGAKIAIPNLN